MLRYQLRHKGTTFGSSITEWPLAKGRAAWSEAAIQMSHSTFIHNLHPAGSEASLTNPTEKLETAERKKSPSAAKLVSQINAKHAITHSLAYFPN